MTQHRKMAETFYTRETLCRELRISERTLERYERAGLCVPRRQNDETVYGPEEARRAWSVVSLHRDLRVNLAGVEAILHLRDQLIAARRQLRSFAEAVAQVERMLSERGGVSSPHA